MIDYTVTLGLDRGTLGYFACNVASWKHFYPEMWHQPWLAFFDSKGPHAVTANEIREVALGADVRCIPWFGAEDKYENQREKMLSGHVYISRVIETPWFLKIDADAIAISRMEWPNPKWFVRDTVLVGPSWGYWRSKGSKYSLEEWCEILESFGDRHFKSPRAGWSERIYARDHHKGPKLRDKNRWVSWLAFQKTGWVRKMANLFEADYGMGMLPVPSHDTSLWAAAVRSGARTLSVPVKAGWMNRTTLRSCRAKMAELGL